MLSLHCSKMPNNSQASAKSNVLITIEIFWWGNHRNIMVQDRFLGLLNDVDILVSDGVINFGQVYSCCLTGFL